MVAEPSQQVDELPTMVTGHGQSDTHAEYIEDTATGEMRSNPHPMAGKDYGTITARDIAKLAASPNSDTKSKARWFIGSSFVEHTARNHEAQRKNGWFHVLPVDIDKGGPSLDDVERAVRRAVGEGTSHIIYSSSSATAESPKWRILFFLSQPVAGEDYKDTQQALFAMLANQGLICDAALDRPGQLVFLPNVPPNKRDQKGAPLFYRYKINRGERMEIAEGNPIYRRREAIRKDVERAREIARLKRDSKRNLPAVDDEEPGVIEAFNAHHDLMSLLEKYGYKRQGASNHWRSPHQSSGSYAVRVYDEQTWVSLSGSDMSAGIGATKDHCCYGDAFDLFRFFEHGNNETAAVRAYGQKINPRQSATVVRLTPPKRPQNDAPDNSVDEPKSGPAEDEEDENTAALRRWAYLSGDNEFCHMDSGQIMGVQAFNLAMARITPLIEYEKADGEIACKKLSAAKTLIDHLDGVVAHSTMYRPDIGEILEFEVDGVPYVNSYLEGSVPQQAKNWREHEAWKICQDHVENILGNDAQTIIQWMAHNVQMPGRKILWAPIVVGVQGDGKTTLAKMLMAAMGTRNVSPVSPESVFSDFTAWAESGCVKVLEEIRVHGNNRYDAMNKLKPLITNDTVEIVRKGRDGKQVINVTNYMALTNHMDALALDDGDRRWGVFKTRFDSRADMLKELDDTYWKDLHDAIDKHPSVVRAWLANVPLGGFNRVAGPDVSSFKRAMIESTKPADQQDVEAAIEVGWLGVSDNLVATDCLNAAMADLSGVRMNTRRMATALTQAGFLRVEGKFKWRGKTRSLWCRKGAGLRNADTEILRQILEGTDDV